MKKLIYLQLLLVILMMQATAQTKDVSWTVQVHKTIIADSVLTNSSITLTKSKLKHKLIVQCLITNNKSDWQRQIIVMNQQRQQLLKEALCNQQFCISIEDLKAITKGENFSIYSIHLPTNPEEAKRVRIAPIRIASFTW